MWSANQNVGTALAPERHHENVEDQPGRLRGQGSVFEYLTK
jgi:hypothetical protein